MSVGLGKFWEIFIKIVSAELELIFISTFTGSLKNLKIFSKIATEIIIIRKFRSFCSTQVYMCVYSFIYILAHIIITLPVSCVKYLLIPLCVRFYNTHSVEVNGWIKRNGKTFFSRTIHSYILNTLHQGLISEKLG